MDRKVDLLYLSQDDVIACGGTDMPMVLEKIEELFLLKEKGETIVPDKISLRWGGAESEFVKGRINAMPGYVGGNVDMAGIKWIGSKPQNPARFNMPRASALTILNDPETGFPVAVMDGTVISAMRTGAATGVAAKYLARKNSRVLTLVGAGTQNHTQLMAVCCAVPSVEEVRVADISSQRAETFASEAKNEVPNVKFSVFTDACEASRGADIIVSATTSPTPIVSRKWIDDGAFIANVGNYEFEYDVVRAAGKIVTDDWQAVFHRGVQTLARMHLDGLLSGEDIYANIGEIVSGMKPGRESDDEIIFYNPVGMGTEDIIVAKEIYLRAKQLNKGTVLNLWTNPKWV